LLSGFGQEHFKISNDISNKNPPANSQSGFERQRRLSWICYTPVTTHDRASNFLAILSKVKAKNPDVIMFGGMDSQGAARTQGQRPSSRRRGVLAFVANQPTWDVV
jgi:hypothetical protein